MHSITKMMTITADKNKKLSSTYKNQSTAMMSPISSSDRLTACRTMMVVTEPAEGMPAAPIAIAVAVTLTEEQISDSISQ